MNQCQKHANCPIFLESNHYVKHLNPELDKYHWVNQQPNLHSQNNEILVAQDEFHHNDGDKDGRKHKQKCQSDQKLFAFCEQEDLRPYCV